MAALYFYFFILVRCVVRVRKYRSSPIDSATSRVFTTGDGENGERVILCGEERMNRCLGGKVVLMIQLE